MNVLIHVNPEDACTVINGTLHRLQPRTPYNVDEHVPAREGTGLGSAKAPDDRPTNVPFITEKIIEDLWYCGVVRVGTERTPYGTDQITEASVADALKLADFALLDADQKTFEEYRSIQETRGIEGRPPLVPTGRYKTVIERRNIDLRKFGINPVGANVVDANVQATETEVLKRDMKEMREQNKRLNSLLEELLAEKKAKKQNA